MRSRRAMLVPALAFAVTAAGAAAPAGADTPDEPGVTGRWRAVTGLRVDQQVTPNQGRVALGVRLALPEMARGALSIETFRWERLDVAQERSALGEDQDTIYQVLGVRYSFDRGALGAFAGAHIMSWSDGEARALTPWLGVRLGRVDGANLTGEARLLGAAAFDPRTAAGAGDADFSLRVSGLPAPRGRLGARARLRDLGQGGGRRRDATAALGVELTRGGRPIFIGVGVQRLEVTPAEAPAQTVNMPQAAMMTAAADEAATGATAVTTVMLQLDVDMALPAALMQ